MRLFSVLGCFGSFSVSADGSPEPTLGTQFSLCPPGPKDRLFHTVPLWIAHDRVCGSKTMNLVSLRCQSRLCGGHNIKQPPGSSI